MSKSTMVEMVEALKQLPPHPEVKVMIEEAKAGEFHDYKNEKYVCGKVASVELLNDIRKKYPECANGCLQIIEDITHGIYDETADEEDVKMMNDTLKEEMDPATAAKFKKILGL